MEHLNKSLPSLSRREKYLGIAYLIFEFTLMSTVLQLVYSLFSPEIDPALYHFLYFSVNFICVLGIFSRFVKKNMLRTVGHPDVLALTVVIGFGLYWVASVALGVLIPILFPDYVNLNDSSLLSIFERHPLLLVLCTVLLAPVAEEMLFRGLVFGWLFEKNKWLAYTLSVFIFAAIHVVQYIGLYSPAHLAVALVQYLPAGIVFAWAYHRSGNLLAPILIHALNNGLAILVLR